MFIDRLMDQIELKHNPSVIGLDPLLEYVPESIREKAQKKYGNTAKAAAKALLSFNKGIIDAICDIAPAVKPQLAYYEMYGYWGVKSFFKTVEYAKQKGLLVIVDGKRNDIGSTAGAYAKAYLGETALSDGITERVFYGDALTINPYLGIDGVAPFLKECKNHGKGVYILVKTSNESSGQLQDLMLQNGKKVYEEVAELVESWGADLIGRHGYSSVGAVVGATYPEQARELRKIMKHTCFLVPGFGAQGGTASDAAAAFDETGRGAIVNASRSVLCAWKHERWEGTYTHEDFGTAARSETVRMRDELTGELHV